jgi:hypothetical protein
MVEPDALVCPDSEKIGLFSGSVPGAGYYDGEH